MRKFLRKVENFLLYLKWTDCQHVWEPEDWMDWRCHKCGAAR